MANHEKTVVDAFLKAADALEAALADGYRINVPINAQALRGIAVSETASVKRPEPAKAPTLANPKPEEGHGGKSGTKS